MPNTYGAEQDEQATAAASEAKRASVSKSKRAPKTFCIDLLAILDR
jgi:hypothetical protein